MESFKIQKFFHSKIARKNIHTNFVNEFYDKSVEKETIFLTTREAIQAIIADFRQYDPQIILFSGVIRLITDNRIHLKREPEKNGAWVNRPGTSRMKWLEGPELVAHMCDAISHTPWNPSLLTDVCARVFQTRAEPDMDPNTGTAGISIETNMEGFSCRQCGCCCRFLDYHNEVTAEDVAVWRKSGRNDILKWVYEIRGDGQPERYQTWVVPGTQEQAGTCPFLEKEAETRRWYCRIHDAKPAFCRQYPLNRKHAIMSGCHGFKKGTTP